MTEIGAGTYTFGRSIDPGLWDITPTGGEGMIALAPELDDLDLLDPAMFDFAWSTSPREDQEKYPRMTVRKMPFSTVIHLEAFTGLRMLIMGSITATIERSQPIKG